MYRLSCILNRALALVDRVVVAQLTVDVPGGPGRISWKIERLSEWRRPRELARIERDLSRSGYR